MNERRSLETAFPEPYLLTETENKIITTASRPCLNKRGMTSHQSIEEHRSWPVGQHREMGQRVAKGTTH